MYNLSKVFYIYGFRIFIVGVGIRERVFRLSIDWGCWFVFFLLDLVLWVFMM